MVAEYITGKESIRDALQGVGEVCSTHDMKDSITFREGRDLTAPMPVPNRGGLHSSLETQGGTRI